MACISSSSSSSSSTPPSLSASLPVSMSPGDSHLQHPTSLTIPVGSQLEYKISTNGSHTTIQCFDTKQFYAWGLDISNDIQSVSNNQEQKTDTIKSNNKLTLRAVFKLFQNYVNGTLSKDAKVFIPESYTCSGKPIIIKISFIIRSVFDPDDYDEEFVELCLNPVEQPENVRFGKKFEVLDKRVEVADQIIQKQKDFIDQKLGGYYTREEIDDFFDGFINVSTFETYHTGVKQRHDAINVKLVEHTSLINERVTKSEMDSSISNTEKKFYTQAQVDTLISTVKKECYTQAEVDYIVSTVKKECYTKAEVDALINHFKTEMNTKISLCYTKTDADTKFQPKA